MKVVLFLIFSSIFLGCASRVGSFQVKNSEAKTPDCEVDVYLSKDVVKRDTEDLCLIDATTGSTLGNRRTVDEAIESAIPQACVCGADAIILKESHTEGASFWGWGHSSVILRAVKYKKGKK